MYIHVHTYIQTCTQAYLHAQTNKPTYLHSNIHAYEHKYNHRCQQINYAYDKITHSDFLFHASFFRFKRTRTYFSFFLFLFFRGSNYLFSLTDTY
jgi:hypothetical protein